MRVPTYITLALRGGSELCAFASQEAIIDAPVPFISALPEVTPQVGPGKEGGFSSDFGNSSSRQVATASGTAPQRAQLLIFLPGLRQMGCT